MNRALTYDAVGSTRPADPEWSSRPAGLRRFTTTVVIGQGPDVWERAAQAVLDWGVKTRSGFTVAAASGGPIRAREGQDYLVTARVGPLVVREPVRVVAVVEDADRRGFAYGTLDGHPVSGEEAFIVHRTAAGTVSLTLRSLTRAPRGPWRAAYPAVLLAQHWYRHRYRRALVPRSR